MLKAAAEQQGITIVGSPMDTPVNDMAYRRAFDAMVKNGAEAVYVGDQAENFVNPKLIVELAHQYRLPAIYPMREAVEMGGFMSYAIDYRETFRHAAVVVDQIFQGAKPGDIPFYQASKFDFAINLNTAKSLGIEISPNLLAQADEVIE
jgi:ABC-type uncharacterized transport system substrate-binding protein